MVVMSVDFATTIDAERDGRIVHSKNGCVNSSTNSATAIAIAIAINITKRDSFKEDRRDTSD